MVLFAKFEKICLVKYLEIFTWRLCILTLSIVMLSRLSTELYRSKAYLGCKKEQFELFRIQNGIAILHCSLLKWMFWLCIMLISFKPVCFMHKIHNHVFTIHFQSLFNINYCIHDHNTWQIDNFRVISHRTNVREYSIKIYGVKLWSSLPTTLKIITSFLLCKKKLKQYCITSQ